MTTAQGQAPRVLSPMPLHARITSALSEVIRAGEEARARGYELPECAADGVVKLNILAVVLRGQEEGQAPSLLEVAGMMADQLGAEVPDVPAAAWPFGTGRRPH